MIELEYAMSLHRAGKLAEAEAIYRRLLSAEPDHAQVLSLLGLIACQRGQLDEATVLLGHAVAREPDNPEYRINLGEVQRRRGNMPEALSQFEQAAQLAPQSTVAQYNLAVALATQGRTQEAIAAYRRAVALQPAFPEALNNLGLLLASLGQNEEAADCLHKALSLRPSHAEAENNLGLILWNLGRHAEALAAFDRALAIKPDFATGHANRAWALRRLGRRQEAADAFQTAARLNPASPDINRDLAVARSDLQQHDAAIAAAKLAVALAPNQADTHHALGVVLAAAGRTDPDRRADAITAYRHALALQPLPEWEYELAMLGGGEGRTPATAPDAYVQRLFDDYAPTFDQHLAQELHYRVPEDMLAALRQVWAKRTLPARDLDVLDLGAGTGRCGELFRPHARTIVGIDLSPKMIAAAQGRRDAAGQPCYDRLICAHIVPALQEFSAAFDLILAADVFIYVGALEAVFAAAHAALRPGGMLAFSLERHDDNAGEDFILRQRFGHSLAYIRRLSAQHHFTEIAAQAAPIRNDVPPGWLVILQRNP